MQTDSLLAIWNLDLNDVRSFLTKRTGPCVMQIGGSLANELGHPGSDVDVFAFCDPPDTLLVTQFSRLLSSSYLSFQSVNLNVFFVSIDALVELGTALYGLIDNRQDETLPHLSHEDSLVLHALCDGLSIAEDGLSDLQTKSGSDIFPLYSSLRGLSRFVAFGDDFVQLASILDTWPALGAARICAEVMTDAALASIGMTNPNFKWRVALAERAVVQGHLPLTKDELLAGLFPGSSSPGDAAFACIGLAQKCIQAIETHAWILPYRQMDTARTMASKLLSHSTFEHLGVS